MKKIIPIVVLGVALAGCATYQNPFTTPTLASIEEAYGAVESIAVGYRDACANQVIPSSCRTIVPVIQAYGKKAQGSVLAARNFVKNYPTLDATSALTAAQAAIADFKKAETDNGVH